MSQSVSRFLHPFDIAKHPSLGPEVKRAILASWASDRVAVVNQPSLRKPPGFDKPVRLDDVLAAMRTLDQKGRSGGQATQCAKAPGRCRERDGRTIQIRLPFAEDRKSVVSGKRVSVRVDLGGRIIINTKERYTNKHNNKHVYKMKEF